MGGNLIDRDRIRTAAIELVTQRLHSPQRGQEFETRIAAIELGLRDGAQLLRLRGGSPGCYYVVERFIELWPKLPIS